MCAHRRESFNHQGVWTVPLYRKTIQDRRNDVVVLLSPHRTALKPYPTREWISVGQGVAGQRLSRADHALVPSCSDLGNARAAH